MRNDSGEDILHGIGLDETLGERGGLGFQKDFLRHVAVIDIEGALELVVGCDALYPLDDSRRSPVGNPEDIIGDIEESFADVASRAFGSSKEVVGNAKYCDIMEVEVFTELQIEVIGLIESTFGGEVVEIIEDDECGFEFVDGLEYVVVYFDVPLIEGADVIEAHKHEVATIG